MDDVGYTHPAPRETNMEPAMIARGIVLSLVAAFASAILAEEPANGPIVVVDSAGKEHKLTAVRLSAGSRRLAFLADPKGTTEDAKKGPIALEVREPKSTTFAKGVVTLIPISCVESVKYEYDKQRLTVAVKGQDPVPGTLQFRGINVFLLEGKNGDASTKFTGGAPKDGCKSIAWPGAKPLASRAVGTTWSVQIVHPAAAAPPLTVRNLKAILSFPGGVEQLLDTLPVRKGESLKLDAKVKNLEIIAVDPNTQMAAIEATVEGSPERLIAVPLMQDLGNRTGTITGFIGEVDCGWKFFPMHTIKVMKPAG